MVRKKRPHKTSPKTPSRVKKRRGKKTRSHSHHHPELVGLGLAGLGVFLAAILWFDLSGGPVAGLPTDAVGAAAYLMPLVLVPLGLLIVARSALVDVRPFRLGLAIALVGLLLTLGNSHGGAVGEGLERVVALGLGTTGATILGVLLTIAGVLLLTGASLGAILRRTGRVVRRVRMPKPRPSAHEPESDSRSESDSRLRAAAGTPGRRQARLPRPRHRPIRRLVPSSTRRDRRDARSRSSSSLRPPATTSCRTASCSRPRSRASARTARRRSGSPTRSSPASRTSASRRP